MIPDGTMRDGMGIEEPAVAKIDNWPAPPLAEARHDKEET